MNIRSVTTLGITATFLFGAAVARADLVSPPDASLSTWNSVFINPATQTATFSGFNYSVGSDGPVTGNFSGGNSPALSYEWSGSDGTAFAVTDAQGGQDFSQNKWSGQTPFVTLGADAGASETMSFTFSGGVSAVGFILDFYYEPSLPDGGYTGTGYIPPTLYVDGQLYSLIDDVGFDPEPLTAITGYSGFFGFSSYYGNHGLGKEEPDNDLGYRFGITAEPGGSISQVILMGGSLAVMEMYVVPVPEPETYAMLFAGLGLLGMIARYRKDPAKLA